jgi:hypothetical protein
MMRSSGNRVALPIPLAALIWLAISPAAGAHRLDEYLQAARVGIARERIDVELDLTPGVAIASRVVDAIDLDRDGSVSADEKAAYAANVADAAILIVDGRRYPLSVSGSSISSFSEMREGIGVIRLTLSAPIPTLSSGRHELRYFNTLNPDISVYLSNAMKPADTGIAIAAQRRDPRQRELRIDVQVDEGSRALVWLLIITVAGAATLALRVRQRKFVWLRADG